MARFNISTVVQVFNYYYVLTIIIILFNYLCIVLIIMCSSYDLGRQNTAYSTSFLWNYLVIIILSNFE